MGPMGREILLRQLTCWWSSDALLRFRWAFSQLDSLAGCCYEAAIDEDVASRNG